MPYSESELACWKQLHCATTKSARKTDRRIILSSCLAWSLDVLGICLVRSCHLRSSFFRFLQHPCPAALRNGEAKCKRSWSKREISWTYTGVSTMCLDTASECRQIFCIDSASAKRLQSKLVDVSGARVSSFLVLMLYMRYMRSSEEHFWWFVHQENGRVKVMSTWCLLLTAKPSRIFESKFWATWGSSAGRFLRTFFCQASNVVSLCGSGRCWNWMTWAWNAGSICGFKPPGGISWDIHGYPSSFHLTGGT